VPRQDKEPRLLEALDALTAHHRAACAPYRRLTDVLGPGDARARRVSDVPWLPIGLFKSHALKSVADADVTTVLSSSGTTGQIPSRVYLDQATARRQSVALTSIMTTILGPRRMPMLIVDQRDLLRNRTELSARGAGVLGMMTFGAQPQFVLDAGMELDVGALEAFLLKHGARPFLIFGFTYMVWAYLIQRIRDRGLDLSQGVLVHSGGWKKLADQAVDNATFRRELARTTGLVRIHNFYGMAEQVGSVFVEGDDGVLHAPAFAEVIARDPDSLEPLPPGRVGVLQVLSALPTSYPGHSLLTEDLGVVHEGDGGGWLGTRFSVQGRIPRAELRGCSDTHASEVRA
jgi:hypothetical protein